jgi:hypothetical protein
LALQTVPFEPVPGQPHTFTADLPAEIEPEDSYICLAVHGGGASRNSMQLEVPAFPHPHTVEVAEFAMGRQPIAMAAYTGHKCFRLVMDEKAKKAFATRRTLQATLAEGDESIRMSLWILTSE